MGLLQTFRKGVKVIDKVVKPLESTVTFRRALSTDETGTVTFANPVSLRAAIDWRKATLRTPTGVEYVVRPTVLFLDIPALLAATGGNAISTWDSITLPDGTTGPILSVSGFIDAGTGRPFAPEVTLG